MIKPSYRELESENLVLRAENKVLQKMVDKLLNISSSANSHHDLMLPKLKSLTLKQQAALQMLLLSSSNAKIAERFGVTESTAKVYVSGIMTKLGATSRAHVSRLMSKTFDEISPQDYEMFTGLPKDWAMKHEDYPKLNAVLFEKTRGKKN